jgi:hypothetical protein
VTAKRVVNKLTDLKRSTSLMVEKQKPDWQTSPAADMGLRRE